LVEETVVTLTADLASESSPLASEDRGQATRQRLLSQLDLLALLFALVVLMGPVVRGAGGRDSGLLVLALGSLIPVICLGRLWRVGPARVSLALAPGVGAIVVCLVSPTGWAGAADVARLLLAGLVWLAVCAVAYSPPRRTAVLVAVCLGGLYQFDKAYLPWWGNRVVSHAMVGSFFAPNVFAGYMAGVALAACALATLGVGRVRLIGFVVGPFCLAAVVYSASRATLALTLLAILVLVLTLSVRKAWRPLSRLGALLAVAAGLTLLLGSSLLMQSGGGPLAGAADKTGTRTLASSGGYRADWWVAALHVGAEHPVAGAGFGSFGQAESRYQRPDDQRTPYAHNLLLQAWSDGGLVLGVPVLLALLGAAWTVRRRLGMLDTAAVASIFGGGVMALHALVDFDAQYPAALALLAVLAGLGAAASSVADRGRWAERSRSGAGTSVALVVVAVLALLLAARFDAADARVRRGQIAGGAWTGAEGPLRDARFDEIRLKNGDHDAGLLARTARLQEDNAAVTWDRAVALIAAGRPAEARQVADKAWAQRAVNQPGHGDRARATAVLVRAFRSAVARPGSDQQPLVLLSALQDAGRTDLVQCLTPEVPKRLTQGSPPLPQAGCTAAINAATTGDRS
jgi:O-antigen ligase